MFPPRPLLILILWKVVQYQQQRMLSQEVNIVLGPFYNYIAANGQARMVWFNSSISCRFPNDNSCAIASPRTTRSTLCRGAKVILKLAGRMTTMGVTGYEYGNKIEEIKTRLADYE